MDTVLTFFSRRWRFLIVCLLIGIFAYILLFRGLNTLTGGLYAQPETVSQQQSWTFSNILQNPVNAPHKLLTLSVIAFDNHNILVTRAVSASLAGMFALLFYWIALHWYSKRVALLATIMFVSSSGFLHIGRYGTGMVLQMATLIVIGCILLYRRTKHETRMLYLVVSLLSLCLYIPGIIWFEIIGLIVMRKRMLHIIRKINKKHFLGLGLLVILLVSPLVAAVISNTSTLRDVFAIPVHIPSANDLLQNLIHLMSSVFYRGYWPHEYWLHGAPLLTIAEGTLFVAGLLVLAQRPILRGNYFLLGSLILSTLLITFGGSVTIAMLIPLVYLTIAGGIYYLLNEWLSIFPRSPVARFTGVALLTVLVATSVMYHLNAYYTAWSNAPETKATYVIKPSL